MKRSYALAISVMLLAACKEGIPTGGGNATAELSSPSDVRIMCALDGAETFKPSCVVERGMGGDRTILVLRSPDGGFRRLRIATDGRGVIAADGAEPAKVEPSGSGAITVSVGNDRYQLPARIKGDAG